MKTIVDRLRARYGAGPLHLLTMLACLALAGYAALRTSADSRWPLMLIWFIGALVGHDLLLFPLYAIADRSLRKALCISPTFRRARTHSVSPLNHLRVPALGCGLTFLLFFPGIIRQGSADYLATTGQSQDPFLGRWLLLCAAMFGISALLYAARCATAGRGRTGAPRSPTEDPVPPLDRPTP